MLSLSNVSKFAPPVLGMTGSAKDVRCNGVVDCDKLRPGNGYDRGGVSVML